MLPTGAVSAGADPSPPGHPGLYHIAFCFPSRRDLATAVLRVLGNLIDAPDFEYLTSEDVRDELVAKLGDVEPAAYSGKTKPAKLNGEDAPEAEIDVPIYSVDGLVRRANALQMTATAKSAAGDDS